MASIGNITNNVFDSILPTFGNPRSDIPVWNESQKMFITSEYESQAGNRYYKGVRFSNRLAIVEKVGLYHTWTYIDEIELYAFDNKERVLIGKKTFDKQFYDTEFIKIECKNMLSDYLRGQMKLMNTRYPEARMKETTAEWIADCYKSLIHDSGYKELKNMMALLESDK